MISGFLALLDDLAIILDDVAVMTKLAAKKSAGVLGDDLALNAKQMVGLDPNKELKVIYQIFKGALKNKLWLVPGAIGLSAISIKIIQVILVMGAIYLCFEGTEKIVDYLEHKINKFKGIYDQKNKHIDQLREKIKNAESDILAYEKDKIKSAIRTDMILSVEVIAITLAIVGSKPIIIQFFTVAIIALLMTIFIYGIVAAIVRIDDVGFWLMARKNKASRWLGQRMIYLTPHLMKGLSLVGTLAMLLVGGSIIGHLMLGEGSGIWQYFWEASIGLGVGGVSILIWEKLIKKMIKK